MEMAAATNEGMLKVAVLIERPGLRSMGELRQYLPHFLA
jgi:hypothetical protein